MLITLDREHQIRVPCTQRVLRDFDSGTGTDLTLVEIIFELPTPDGLQRFIIDFEPAELVKWCELFGDNLFSLAENHEKVLSMKEEDDRPYTGC